VNEFWVGSYFSEAAVIRQRLEAYVIADDVVIEDTTEDWSAVSLMCDGAKSLLPELRRVGRAFPAGARAKKMSSGLSSRATRDDPHAACRTSRTWPAKRLRVGASAAGIAAVPGDIGPGDLPNEGGLELDAISYTKGCYLGSRK